MGWTLLLVPSLLLLGLWWPCCGGASNATWAGRRLLVQPVHARPASPAYNEWDDVRPADRELAELHMVPRKRLRGGHHVAKLRVSKHGSGVREGEGWRAALSFGSDSRRASAASGLLGGRARRC